MVRTLRQNLKDFLRHLRAAEEALRWPYCENEEESYTKRTFILFGFQVHWTKDTPVSLQKTAFPWIRITSEICSLKQEHFSFNKTEPFIKTLGTLRTYCFWKVTYYFWRRVPSYFYRRVPSFRHLSTHLLEQPRSIQWHQLENLYLMEISIPVSQ